MAEQVTVQSIRAHYEAEKAKLLTATFDAPLKAAEAATDISRVAMDTLGSSGVRQLRAAEIGEAAEAERASLKERYVELELEMLAAVEVRVAQIEELLAPENASFQDYAAAATATPEALIAAMDLALSSGDEDAALVAFAAARQQDLADVVAHAADAREDWSDLLSELQLAQSDPELDPGDRFEMFAQDVPSKHQIFNQLPADINILGSELGKG